jgi:hypothetical protein
LQYAKLSTRKTLERKLRVLFEDKYRVGKKRTAGFRLPQPENQERTNQCGDTERSLPATGYHLFDS